MTKAASPLKAVPDRQIVAQHRAPIGKTKAQPNILLTSKTPIAKASHIHLVVENTPRSPIEERSESSAQNQSHLKAACAEGDFLTLVARFEQSMRQFELALQRLNLKPEWLKFGPFMTRIDLADANIVQRTTSYLITDPEDPSYDEDFPVGFKLFDAPRAPTVWWTAEIAGWSEARADTYRARAIAKAFEEREQLTKEGRR